MKSFNSLLHGNDLDGVDLGILRLSSEFDVELAIRNFHRHGFNMGDRSSFAAVRDWPHRLADWLADRGLLTPTSAAGGKPASH